MTLKKFFKTNSKPLIGLDIGCVSLHWVELAQDDKAGLVLERCTTETLQSGWIVAGHIVQFDEVVAALRRLVKASGSSRQVALAMPDTSVMSSKIRCPLNLGPAELLRRVEAEVERLSGKPLIDMCVDYKVQGQDHAAKLDAEVWIATSAKEQVQDRLGLAEAAGLTAVVLDVEAEASMRAARRLARARDPASSDPAMALVQTKAEGCSLHVTCQGEIVHAACQTLDNAPQAELSTPAVLQPCVQTLADSLANDLDGFLSASARNKIDTILLAGGASWLPMLLKAIKQRTFSDCVLADAFSGMRIDEATQHALLHSVGPSSMLTACGLAMRRFQGGC